MGEQQKALTAGLCGNHVHREVTALSVRMPATCLLGSKTIQNAADSRNADRCVDVD